MSHDVSFNCIYEDLNLSFASFLQMTIWKIIYFILFKMFHFDNFYMFIICTWTDIWWSLCARVCTATIWLPNVFKLIQTPPLDRQWLVYCNIRMLSYLCSLLLVNTHNIINNHSFRQLVWNIYHLVMCEMCLVLYNKEGTM